MEVCYKNNAEMAFFDCLVGFVETMPEGREWPSKNWPILAPLPRGSGIRAIEGSWVAGPFAGCELLSSTKGCLLK
jgi:hypothetical protein